MSGTAAFLRLIGVPELPPRTCPFDPGYDPVTLGGHLDQSARLMEILKVSMAGWLVADEGATRAKVQAATRAGVATVTGGGPFEVAATQGRLPEYLDLCADIGFTRVECGEGFTDLASEPEEVAAMARERGLAIQYELGKKHGWTFTRQTVEGLVVRGRRWLEAAAEQHGVEARESAAGLGPCDRAR